MTTATLPAPTESATTVPACQDIHTCTQAADWMGRGVRPCCNRRLWKHGAALFLCNAHHDWLVDALRSLVPLHCGHCGAYLLGPELANAIRWERL